MRRVARESERALGRMLLAARQAGDLAGRAGGGTVGGRESDLPTLGDLAQPDNRKPVGATDRLTTLADLNIDRDLAALGV